MSEPPSPSPAARQGPEELVVVESCTTTWAFDTTRRRFARLPRGLTLNHASAEWRPYTSMAVDWESGSVEVALDSAGTNLLRSEIHTSGPCPHCGTAQGPSR